MKRYEKYKGTNFSLIDEIPYNWKIQKIKFIADIYNGDSLNDDYKVQFESDNPNDLAYISSKNINVDNSSIHYENGMRIPRDYGKFKIAKANSPLLCIEGGSAGRKIAFTNQDVYFVNKLACFKTKNKETSKFLYYTLKSIGFQSQFKNAISGMIGGVSISIIRNFYISIPSLQEQIQIAVFLDHQTGVIDNLIKQKEKIIELLNEKRQDVIFNLATKGLNQNVDLKKSDTLWWGKIPSDWSIKRIKFLFEIKKEIAGKLGYEVLSVTQKGIKVRDLDNLKGQLSMDYSKYQIVGKGEFIMNHMDLLTGYIDISKYDGVTSPDYRVFKAKSDEVCSEYYLFIFQFCYHNKIFFGLGQGVSDLGRWRMPSENFNNFPIPVPPFKEQVKIASKIKETILMMEQYIEKEKYIVEKLKEYRQSLISEAVTGKIDVRDWQPKKQAVV